MHAPCASHEAKNPACAAVDLGFGASVAHLWSPCALRNRNRQRSSLLLIRFAFLFKSSKRAANQCSKQIQAAQIAVMTVLLDPSILSDLETCRTRLGKKATFEKAIVDVCLILRTQTAQRALAPVHSKLMEVCARCMTLLKARYTSTAFWKAGDEMLAESQVSCLMRIARLAT